MFAHYAQALKPRKFGSLINVVVGLHPAMKARKNLTVLVRAQATRVMIEGTRAVGVEYLQNGKIERVRADREPLALARERLTQQPLDAITLDRPADLP